MCIMKTYETRGRDVLDPPPRRSNFTAHPPAGVMSLPREWRRSNEYVDRERIEYRRSQPRVIEYVEYDERPRSSRRSVSRRRISDVEFREPRRSYVDERTVRRSTSRVRY